MTNPIKLKMPNSEKKMNLTQYKDERMPSRWYLALDQLSALHPVVIML